MLECNLKNILKYRGIKQSHLSSKVGVTNQAIHSWHTGKSAPSLETAFKIAEYLDCSVYDIWSYKEESEHQTSK